MTHRPEFWVAGDYTISAAYCDECCAALIGADPMGDYDEEAWNVDPVMSWQLSEWADNGAVCDTCGAVLLEATPDEDGIMSDLALVIQANDPQRWISFDDGDCDPWGAVMGLFFGVAEVCYVRSDDEQDEELFDRIRMDGKWSFRPGALVDDSWRMTDEEASEFFANYDGDSDEIDVDKVCLDRLNAAQLVAIGDACNVAADELRKLGKDY